MSSEQNNKDPETTSWLQALYQIAHSDTRWAKEQGWQVVNWTLLLFGALLGIQKLIPALPLCAIFVADAAVTLVAVFYLIDLQWWSSGMRRTADKIEEQIPNAASILERRIRDRNHYKYLVIQFLVIVGALGFVVLAQCYLSQK